jgi:hypothetical protein
MAVDEPEKIDGLGFRPDDGQLELLVYDHLDWNDEDLHLEAITDKLNGYMHFLNGTQLAEMYPDKDASAYDKPWLRIVFAYSPTETGVAFLQGLADQLRPHGLTVAYDLTDTQPRSSFVL